MACQLSLPDPCMSGEVAYQSLHALGNAKTPEENSHGTWLTATALLRLK